MQTLNLDPVELQRYKEFRSQHCGELYFQVYLGSIGTKVIVVCSGCGEELDISNYDSW